MDWQQINAMLNAAERILLTSHENPDGDGLGSAVAMYHHLRGEGKDCRIINCSPIPQEYDFLNHDGIIEMYTADEHDKWLQDCDLAIIFDVGDFKRLRGIKTAIESFNIDTMNIDHHPHLDDHPFTINIVDTQVAATGVLVYEYLKMYRQEPLSKDICAGIYTAIMTDTGSFRFSNTDAKCHEIAMECLEVGVETSKIYQRVYETKPQSSVRLLARVIDNVTFENDGELAWFMIDQNMLVAAEASSKDVDGFTDFVRTIKGVEVAVMVFENGSDVCRINFRSKGKYVINDIAKHFGGGGHKFAAGAVIKGNKETIVPQVISETKASLERQAA
ncbi:MAG TPA: bifunctional oligoribonuclease/PAP phosphatase NrnA [Candidatus Marinimicrobia bacterium]|jgi:phosphoesterase RecJ-like protein|nr:bifunctional oligoribonuclease/PAP phosphatase NrnA [Candidatus Neomarinimicrobiota bacterium]MDP7216851.1 bifunctional oligoribonuclease/PAP phosphatase NrnA [Candidatus Neomarinimicrobiota bacterium]HJL73832.1 bifunctional oligoribonuclease/PAP phosphatase NrnA [Candidatus Neomarinimicrobiota bacterium]HJM69868.1 bifunctional oligoribonuclease/PAP phosphatase NrnA [Candidatus Neomarinimicrobiota bacterium]|tara:strand:- start:14218 stop:15213 length:996 start_codon:yes stop_codon:yes gene_type:complete